MSRKVVKRLCLDKEKQFFWPWLRRDWTEGGDIPGRGANGLVLTFGDVEMSLEGSAYIEKNQLFGTGR